MRNSASAAGKFPLLPVQITKIAGDIRRARLQISSLLKFLFRLVRSVLTQQKQAKPVVSLVPVRGQLHRPTVFFFRFLYVAVPIRNFTQYRVRHRQRRLQPDRFSKMLLGLVKLSDIEKRRGKIILHLRILRHQNCRLAKIRFRLIEMTVGQARGPQAGVRVHVIRRKRHRFPIGLLHVVETLQPFKTGAEIPPTVNIVRSDLNIFPRRRFEIGPIASLFVVVCFPIESVDQFLMMTSEGGTNQ